LLVYPSQLCYPHLAWFFPWRNETMLLWKYSQVSVVYAYNPNYWGGWDEEDHGLKPALGKQFTRPYLENTYNNKKTMGWGSGWGGRSARVASVKPWVQTPMLQKNKPKTGGWVSLVQNAWDQKC
jgi:hypothetical protein